MEQMSAELGKNISVDQLDGLRRFPTCAWMLSGLLLIDRDAWVLSLDSVFGR